MYKYINPDDIEMEDLQSSLDGKWLEMFVMSDNEILDKLGEYEDATVLSQLLDTERKACKKLARTVTEYDHKALIIMLIEKNSKLACFKRALDRQTTLYRESGFMPETLDKDFTAVWDEVTTKISSHLKCVTDYQTLVCKQKMQYTHEHYQQLNRVHNSAKALHKLCKDTLMPLNARLSVPLNTLFTPFTQYIDGLCFLPPVIRTYLSQLQLAANELKSRGTIKTDCTYSRVAELKTRQVTF